MVDRPEHRVRHRHVGFLVPAMPHHASVPGPQRTVLGADRRPGGFDEGHPQPPVAFPGLPRLMLPRALVVARTDSRPTGQMPIARETAHIHPELGADHVRDALMSSPRAAASYRWASASPVGASTSFWKSPIAPLPWISP